MLLLAFMLASIKGNYGQGMNKKRMFIVLEMSLVFQRSRNSSWTFIFLYMVTWIPELSEFWPGFSYRSHRICRVEICCSAFLREESDQRGNESLALRCERLHTLYVLRLPAKGRNVGMEMDQRVWRSDEKGDRKGKAQLFPQDSFHWW